MSTRPTRAPAPEDPDARRRFVVALAIALLLHLALFAGLRDWTRVHPFEPARVPHVMQLRLIDPTAPPAAEPVPSSTRSAATPRARSAPPPPHPYLRTSVPAPPEVPPMVGDAAALPSAAAATVRLFNRDGTIDLPTAPVDADPAVFGSRKKIAAHTPDPMVHQSPLPYVPTMFERDWKPRDETLLDEFARNATVSRTWDTRGGTRISCGALLVFVSCAWGWTPRVTIEELKRMRADPPMPRPAPLLPDPAGP